MSRPISDLIETSLRCRMPGGLFHFLPDMNLNGHCLIKNNISLPKKVINLYISYTLGPQLRHVNTDFTLSNCLFGPDLDKYKYTGRSVGFDSRSEFLFPDGSYGKMSNSLELI